MCRTSFRSLAMPHGRGPCRGFWRNSGARPELSSLPLYVAGSFAARSSDRDVASNYQNLSDIFCIVAESPELAEVPSRRPPRAGSCRRFGPAEDSSGRPGAEVRADRDPSPSSLCRICRRQLLYGRRGATFRDLCHDASHTRLQSWQSWQSSQ